MGSWSVCCGISKIAITSGHECAIIALKEDKTEYGGWVPTTLPIFGEYNDYGGMDKVVEDANTKLIEEYLGITIDEFIEFLVDGKFTYDRDEVAPIVEKLKKLGMYETVKDWRFMWVDKKVYDAMTLNTDEWHKGMHELGMPKFMEAFGFILDKDAVAKNYDPKRYKYVWKKEDIILYGDGENLIQPKGGFVWSIGKDDSADISKLVEVPEELKYLSKLSKEEAWRFYGDKFARTTFGQVFGSRNDWDMDDFMSKSDHSKHRILYKRYLNDLEAFGDDLLRLFMVRMNLHPMSSRFEPHVLYLTPQSGEFERHQIFLDKFAEINRSYLEKED